MSTLEGGALSSSECVDDVCVVLLQTALKMPKNTAEELRR